MACSAAHLGVCVRHPSPVTQRRQSGSSKKVDVRGHLVKLRARRLTSRRSVSSSKKWGKQQRR